MSNNRLFKQILCSQSFGRIFKDTQKSSQRYIKWNKNKDSIILVTFYMHLFYAFIKG